MRVVVATPEDYLGGVMGTSKVGATNFGQPIWPGWCPK